MAGLVIMEQGGVTALCVAMEPALPVDILAHLVNAVANCACSPAAVATDHGARLLVAAVARWLAEDLPRGFASMANAELPLIPSPYCNDVPFLAMSSLEKARNVGKGLWGGLWGGRAERWCKEGRR